MLHTSQEDVHKVMVYGNKNRIHNPSDTGLPISQREEHPF